MIRGGLPERTTPRSIPTASTSQSVWYSPSNIENAEGPLLTDPSHGRDPRRYDGPAPARRREDQPLAFRRRRRSTPVRNVVMPLEVMDESLAYVAAHEMGHCLGLAHNMAGSSAIPVDSLCARRRSRRNTARRLDHGLRPFQLHVAQPGDEGVRASRRPRWAFTTSMPSAGFTGFVPDAAVSGRRSMRIAPGMPATRCRYAALRTHRSPFLILALARTWVTTRSAPESTAIRNLKYITTTRRRIARQRPDGRTARAWSTKP